ncbi:carbamoyltransferase [Candidatus Auribacterota bacterium]
MKILGIHAGHESGAALIQDGKVTHAIAEERLLRNKLIVNAPTASIKWVLEYSGLKPSDIDVIAVSVLDLKRHFAAEGLFWRKKAAFTKGRSLLEFEYTKDKKLERVTGPLAVVFNLLAITGLPRYMLLHAKTMLYIKFCLPGFKGKVLLVDHHDAHVSSAYFTSGKKEALSVVSEGMDGRNTFKIDSVNDGVMKRIATTPFPHSPGTFYSVITKMLGFNPVIHAGKVTGLAAYGDPKKAYDKVSKLMWTEGNELRCSPKLYELEVESSKKGEYPDYFKGHTREDLSAAFQQRFEDCIVSLVSNAVKETGMCDLVLSGGCHANVKLNQRVAEIEGVKSVFVHPCMGDGGLAVGSALYAANTLNGKRGSYELNDVYFGPEYGDLEVENALKKFGLEYTRPDDIEEKIAEILADHKIVARYWGRMEYGPRALGNRSILYHCKDNTVNDWLNEKLDRTEFMPFAPAVMSEHADKLFIDVKGKEYTSKFMTITFDCTDWMKETCPAVVHIDGTARPQFVDAKCSPHFYRIIKLYYEKTGIPVVLNTSYNIHNEPIVCTPEDALRAFCSSKLDYLAIGNYLVSSDALK